MFPLSGFDEGMDLVPEMDDFQLNNTGDNSGIFYLNKFYYIPLGSASTNDTTKL